MLPKRFCFKPLLAGAGIAKATALAYAREGAKVAIIELNKETGAAAEAEVRAAGGAAIFIETDVTNDDSVKRAVEATVARYGKLDVLMNCAGGSLQEDVPVHEMDLDVWHHTVALNLLHPFLTCRHAIPHMMKGGGSIINMTSHLGLMGSMKPAYAATKGGIISFTKTLAAQYADYGIRANGIAPGSIRTERQIRGRRMSGCPGFSLTLTPSRYHCFHAAILRRRKMMKAKLWLLLIVFAACAHAETGEVRIARQFGITFLPLMVMEQQKLVEKHAKAAGLGEVKANHLIVGTPAAINDAILSGAAHFVAVGPPSFAALWARSRGTPSEPVGIASVTYLNMMMNSRDPRIKSIRDLTDKNRIAMPSPKVSLPAIILQIAAAKEYGYENYARFDALGVGMAHPDAMAALLSGGQADICCHFASPPYQAIELAQPGMHTVVSVNEVMGGPTTGTMLFTTVKFRNENPKLSAAVYAALKEAIDFINTNKRAAADVYLQLSKDKSKPEDILVQLNDPALRFDLTPLNVMKYFDFMHNVGSIKAKPASWKEIFAPEVHSLPGS